MQNTISNQILQRSQLQSDHIALRHQGQCLSYAELSQRVQYYAAGLRQLNLSPGEHIALHANKGIDSVCALLASLLCKLTVVPLNPLLKPAQIQHILVDAGITVLISNQAGLQHIQPRLAYCSALKRIILNDDMSQTKPLLADQELLTWDDLSSPTTTDQPQPADIEAISPQAMAMILYTSGSTGAPKGVMLSHSNLSIGATVVKDYLQITSTDRILALLPLSFDYGLNQILSGLLAGAEVILMDYLLPRDVLTTLEKEAITVLAGVPSLWNPLAKLDWPKAVQQQLRIITNSGGALSDSTLASLEKQLSSDKIVLMYGLTEAFRASYLPPAEFSTHRGSIGRAIPQTELFVVKPDGEACKPGEIGELVQAGALVSLGYWNQAKATAAVFKPLPLWAQNKQNRTQLAVWSGDQVCQDEEGYLYFIGRKDAMIKSSGYRISPDEIESLACAHHAVDLACALGVEDPALGQSIVLYIQTTADNELNKDLEKELKRCLPNYMQPKKIIRLQQFPMTSNAKIDRNQLHKMFCASTKKH